MKAPKLYLNSNDAQLFLDAFPGLEGTIEVLPAADDLTFEGFTGLMGRLNQNLKDGKPIAPVKIREEKTAYWLAGNQGRG